MTARPVPQCLPWSRRARAEMPGGPGPSGLTSELCRVLPFNADLPAVLSFPFSARKIEQEGYFFPLSFKMYSLTRV